MMETGENHHKRKLDISIRTNSLEKLITKTGENHPKRKLDMNIVIISPLHCVLMV